MKTVHVFVTLLVGGEIVTYDFFLKYIVGLDFNFDTYFCFYCLNYEEETIVQFGNIILLYISPTVFHAF